MSEEAMSDFFSPFKTRAAATGTARSPTVDNRVRQTISDDDDAERRRPRTIV